MSAFQTYFASLLFIRSVLIVHAHEWDIVMQEEFQSIYMEMTDIHGWNTFYGKALSSSESASSDILAAFVNCKYVVRPRSPIPFGLNWAVSKTAQLELFKLEPMVADIRRSISARDDEWQLLRLWEGKNKADTSDGEKTYKAGLLLFHHSQTDDVQWFDAALVVRRRAGDSFIGESWKLRHIRDEDVLKNIRSIMDIPSHVKSQQEVSDTNAERLRLQKEIEDQRWDYEHFRERVIWIACVSTGALSFVFGVVFLGLRCKWRKDLRTEYIQEDDQNVQKIFVADTVVPGILENNRPPILVDECEKFGMNEIYGVTAGEGSDLIRIARPLETAGAARKLSEELLNIQPIYQDEEGRDWSKLHGTSPGGTKGGDVMVDDLGENQRTAE